MDPSNPISDICAICELCIEQDNEKTNIKTKRGQSTLKKISELRRDGKFSALDLEKDLHDIITHVPCRQAYYISHRINAKIKPQGIIQSNLETPLDYGLVIKDENGQVSNTVLLQLDSMHRDDEGFDYRNLCLFCGEDASETYKWQQLRMKYLQKPAKTVKNYALVPGETKQVLYQATLWGEEVLERVKDKDLVYLNARYHADCCTLYAAAPQKYKPSSRTKGQHFENVMKNLKNEFKGVDIEEWAAIILTNTGVNRDEFDFGKHCIICAKDATALSTNGSAFQIKRLNTAQPLVELVSLSSADKWRNEMRRRVENVDLVSANGRCHKVCYVHCYKLYLLEVVARAQSAADQQYYDNLYKDYIMSDGAEFDYRMQCVVCGKAALKSDEAEDIRLVRRQYTAGHLLAAAQRFHDKWRTQVRDRVSGRDLVSLGARYHKTCYPQFVIPPPQTETIVDTEFMEKDIYQDMYEDMTTYYGLVSTNELKEMSYFDFKNCYICGQDASDAFVKNEAKKPCHKRICIHVAKTYSFFQSLRKILARNEDRDNAIRKRVGDLSDEELLSLGIRYHVQCSSRFQYDRSGVKRGRRRGRPPGRTDDSIALLDWRDSVEHETDISLDRHDDSGGEHELIDDQRMHVQDWQDRYNTTEEGRGTCRPSGLQDSDVRMDYYVEISPQNDPKARPNQLSPAEVKENIKFDFKNYCFICGQDALEQNCTPINSKKRISVLQKESSIKTLREILKTNDTRHRLVQKRISGLKDEELLSIGLRYHPDCYLSLRRKERVTGGKRMDADGYDIPEDGYDRSEDGYDRSEDGHDRSEDGYDISINEGCRLNSKYKQNILQNQDVDNHNWGHMTENNIRIKDERSNTSQKAKVVGARQKKMNYDKIIEISQAPVVKTRRKMKEANEMKWLRLICNTCLSAGRRLHRLEQYTHVFRAVCGTLHRKQTYVCWECLGVLKKINEFKDRAQQAHNILNKILHLSESQLPSSLSTFTTILLDNFAHDGDTGDICEDLNTIEIKQESANGTNNQIFVKETKDVQFNDEHIKNRQAVVNNEDTFVDNCNDNYYDAFVQQDDGFNNKKESTRVDKVNLKNNIKDHETVEKTSTTLTTHKFTNDDDSDSYDGNDSANCVKVNVSQKDKEKGSNIVKGKLKRSSVCKDISDDDDNDSTSLESDSEVPPKKRKSEDSDYEPPPEKESKRKINKTYPKNYKISYGLKATEIVKKVAIDPKETQMWMEKERNSEYFKNLKRKCQLCVSKLVDETREQHLKTLHRKTPTSHTCSICKIVFKSLEKLKEHLKLHYFVLQCDFCGYQCYAKGNMLSHLQRHPRTVECLECGAHFGLTSEFFKHYKEQHRIFNCDSCCKQFPRRENLKFHIERYHTVRKCDECGKIFNSHHRLTQHIEFLHSVDPPEQCYCVSCGIQFPNKRKYSAHLHTALAHESERPKRREPEVVACSACDQEFPTHKKYQYHYVKCHSDQKFQCPHCGKVFRRKNNMSYHIKRVHERVPLPRNKICQYCGRGFTDKRILRHHIRTHTGERPFKCQHCDAGFAQKTAMNTHVKTVHKQIVTSTVPPKSRGEKTN